MTLQPSAIKLIVFDTFGTVVDWRGSIIRDLSEWGRGQGVEIDWGELALRWRARYRPQMDRVRSGEIAWTNLDALHHEALGQVLAEMNAPPLTPAQHHHVNMVWHRLEPWSDAVPGMTRLRARHVIGSLSNGNVALLVNMARHAGLPWDFIFSCELFHRYKPDPETYLGACRLMALEPSQVMMCAAHNEDLSAARSLGLATAFVVRPAEYGPGQTSDLSAEEDWDVVCASLEELAAKMGC